MVTLRASEIFSNSELQLITLESVDFQHSKRDTGYRLYGNIEPIAVIVCGPDGTYVLDMEAKLVAFDQLRQNIPDLDAIIAPFYKAKKLRFRTEAK